MKHYNVKHYHIRQFPCCMVSSRTGLLPLLTVLRALRQLLSVSHIQRADLRMFWCSQAKTQLLLISSSHYCYLTNTATRHTRHFGFQQKLILLYLKLELLTLVNVKSKHVCSSRAQHALSTCSDHLCQLLTLILSLKLLRFS